MNTPTDYLVHVSTGQEGFKTYIRTGSHQLIVDEPASVGGTNEGPTPYGLLLASLGACTAMTLRMYADRKKWPLETVEVALNHSQDYHQDCMACAESNAKIDVIQRVIQLHGNLDEAQIKRLMDIADKCPVHKTLTSTTVIKTRLANEDGA